MLRNRNAPHPAIISPCSISTYNDKIFKFSLDSRLGIADTLYMNLKRDLLVILTFSAILTAMFLAIHFFHEKPEPTHCECKCFTAGYLQACKDFDNLMDT